MSPRASISPRAYIVGFGLSALFWLPFVLIFGWEAAVTLLAVLFLILFASVSIACGLRRG